MSVVDNRMVQIYGDTYLSRKFGKAEQIQYAPEKPVEKPAVRRVQHGSALICGSCGCKKCMDGRRLGAALGSGKQRYYVHARRIKDGRIGR